MEEIMIVPIELEYEAKRASDFRGRMKTYLTSFGECYDKFTVTENDTFLGYVSETAVSNYLVEKYSDKIEVKKWEDSFDLQRIEKAVTDNDGNSVEVAYVKEFFYDKYDLEIIEKKTGKSIYVDVKTAETRNEPQNWWDFLYPVVQNQRKGKDCVVLCYYYKTEKCNKILLVGYISEEDISKKKILPAGSVTKFGTTNQIDNYETKLMDYQSLARMLNIYYGYLRRPQDG